MWYTIDRLGLVGCLQQLSSAPRASCGPLNLAVVIATTCYSLLLLCTRMQYCVLLVMPD